MAAELTDDEVDQIMRVVDSDDWNHMSDYHMCTELVETVIRILVRRMVGVLDEP